MKDPVCPLVLALYGHPDAGTCWEQHCDKMLKQVGFEPIVNWSGCYRHNTLRAVLSVYVDDFKLACHHADEKKVWALIMKHVSLEAPIPMKQYLGCGHRIHEHPVCVLRGASSRSPATKTSWAPPQGTLCIAWNTSWCRLWIKSRGYPRDEAVAKGADSVPGENELLHERRAERLVIERRTENPHEDPLLGPIL